MKRIFLVAVNSKFTHVNPVPYYIRNELNGLDYNIEIKQYNINQDYFSILKDIVLVKPSVIAFSVYIWNCELIETLIKDLKNLNSNVIIVAGGPEASYNKKWLNIADFVVKGEGEKAFRKLAINNFQFKEKEIVEPILNFNDIQFPYLESDLKDLENKYIYYEASRGCPYKCSYCISSRVDQSLKFRDINRVFKELDFLINSKCKVIKFVDRSFNCNKDFSRKIWEYLIQNHKENVKFHFEIYPALLKEEDFKILNNTPEGYFQFEIGIQSANKNTLVEINRHEDPKIVKENILKLKNLENIHIHLDLIAGLPFETLNEIKNSFNFIYKMEGDHFQLGFLKVLPGTELEENKKNYEIVTLNKPPYTVLKNKWLSFQDVFLLQNIEEFLEIYKNSHKFENTINYLEDKFNSPFDLYYQLSELTKNLESLQFDKSLKNYFKLIFEFSKNIENIDKILLNDLLRIDWFSGGNFVNVPEFLKTGNEGCRKLPKFIIEFIKNNIKNCTQRAFVKLNSKDLIEKNNNNNFMLFYREKNKNVFVKYLNN